MKHTSFFQIEPTSAARLTFPTVVEAGYAELLLESVLTSRSWVDRSSWRPEAVAAAVKLLYLARVREYVFLSSISDARKVLGSESISIQVFDRWWTLRQIPFDEPSEHWERYLAPVAGHVEATGNGLIDDLVQSLLKHG
jgi:hypothetical protein